MKLKQDSREFSNLANRFNKFSEIETIDKLKEYYLPKMNKFCDHIDQFLESNIETRDCVRKLDSDLSLKCSKSELLAHKLEMDNKYIGFSKYNNILL